MAETAFETLANEAFVPALLDQFGETVAWTSAFDSVVRSISAIVVRETLQDMGPNGPTRPDYRIRIFVKRADLVYQPQPGDTVALDKRRDDASASTYRITSVLSQDGGFVELAL